MPPKAKKRDRVVLRQGRETVLGRVAETIEQRRTMLIATNGRSTEHDYLKALRQEPWVRCGKIAVVIEEGSPVDLVRGAAKRASRDDYDETWAVRVVDSGGSMTEILTSFCARLYGRRSAARKAKAAMDAAEVTA